MIRRALMIASLIPPVSAVGVAQTVLREFLATEPGEAFGTSVAPVGDLDGDGRAEVAVSGPGFGPSDTGRVRVFAGVDGAPYLTVLGAFANGRFGESIDGGGDVDGDGFPDLAIGSPDVYQNSEWGQVLLYSGLDGALLFEADRSTPCGNYAAEYGWSVSLMDDFDGDGLADVGIGTNTSSVDDAGATTVVGHRPADPDLNEVLWNIACNCWCEESFGISVDGGDLNGDGYADVVIGMHDFNFEVRVFHGPDGAFGWKSNLGGSYAKMTSVHEWIKVLGDLNGDGKDDVAVAVVGAASSSVTVRSGADGTPLFFVGGTGSQLGSAGDFDGDGVPDLLIGNPEDDTVGADAGAVFVHSGSTGALLATLRGTAAGDRFGASVDGAGDVNGDGLDDFIVGAPGAANGGYARVFSGGAVPTPSTYCVGKVNSQGCLPLIDWGGDPTLTGPDDFLVLTRAALVGKPGLFFYGLDGVIAVPFFGAELCVRPPLVRTLPTNAMGPSDCQAGNAFHFSQALMVAEGLQVGDVVQGQFWMRDPTHPDGTGVGLTNAITIPILP